MPPRARMTLATMSVVFFLIPAVALYSELSKRSDIWWTPLPLAVPLTESTDRIQVLVRAKPLESLLDAGALRMMESMLTVFGWFIWSSWAYTLTSFVFGSTLSTLCPT